MCNGRILSQTTLLHFSQIKCVNEIDFWSTLLLQMDQKLAIKRVNTWLSLKDISLKTCVGFIYFFLSRPPLLHYIYGCYHWIQTKKKHKTRAYVERKTSCYEQNIVTSVNDYCWLVYINVTQIEEDKY